MAINEVLKKIAFQVYQERAVMPEKLRTNYRIERVNGGLLCDLWFLTVGCIHDSHGGCVMCNYGKSCGKINQTRILKELENIVDRLPWEFEDFLLTPSGSMLDEREVSNDMRQALVPILQKVKAKRFIIETRVDTITDSGISFLKSVVPEAEKYIEIGVESSDDWILKNCINKGSTFAQFKDVVKKLHKNEIYVTANIGLGYPFMSERASIKNTIQAIKDALNVDADSIVLFPYHIKRGTVLEKLHKMGMYESVSLWALVEVLANFSKVELQKIQISWYKDYFGEERSLIYHSPQTCSQCYQQVIEELDRYRDTQDISCVEKLESISCVCKQEWKASIESQSEKIEMDTVEQAYRKIGEEYKIDNNTLECTIDNMYREYAGR